MPDPTNRLVKPYFGNRMLLQSGPYYLIFDACNGIDVPGTIYLSQDGQNFFLVELCGEAPQRQYNAIQVTFEVPHFDITGTLAQKDDGAITAQLQNSEELSFQTPWVSESTPILEQARFYGTPSGLVGMHLLCITMPDGPEFILVACSLDLGDKPKRRYYYCEDWTTLTLTDITSDVTGHEMSGFGHTFRYEQHLAVIKYNPNTGMHTCSDQNVTLLPVGKYSLAFTDDREKVKISMR